MAISTARDIVTAALRDLGVLASGETATASDASDGLDALNALIDQWKAERLLIYTVTRTTWSITASDGEYSVGTGGDISVARPVFVSAVRYIDTSTTPDTEYDLGEPLTEDQWAAISLKADTNVYPTCYYYNPTYPLGTLTLWPAPTCTTLQGALYAPAASGEFSALTTAISHPPGYRRMMIKNLAVELAPSYVKSTPPEILRAAEESMAVVKRTNARISDQKFPASVLGSGHGSYDIYTDS